MTIDDAIKQLEEIKAQHGLLPMRVWVQTGPDSWEWKKVIRFDPAWTQSSGGPVVDVVFE